MRAEHSYLPYSIPICKPEFHEDATSLLPVYKWPAVYKIQTGVSTQNQVICTKDWTAEHTDDYLDFVASDFKISFLLNGTVVVSAYLGFYQNNSFGVNNHFAFHFYRNDFDVTSFIVILNSLRSSLVSSFLLG